MKDSDFKNKRILITGINGFIGKALEKRLSFLGVIVFGISKSSGDGNKILKADVLNYKEIDKFIKDKKIQICYHLAGESLVEEGQSRPFETFKVNIEGTLNILEIARKNNLEKIIIASTAHVYGDNPVPYLEEYTPRPSRPYETSKACTDLLAQSYADSFNLPVLIPRFVNIYGPGDLNLNRLIPKTIKNVLNGKSPEMWGGSAMRDYIYIDDAIDAYVSLGKLDKKLVERNRIYNFGTGNLISVKDLIEKIIDLSGANLSIKILNKKRSNEITVQYLSSKKASRILAWKPGYALDAGLKKTLVWYKDYFNKVML
ncbi:MAG: NAD(P)-dependent oxidoreductase [Patescibacteria group bacterium]